MLSCAPMCAAFVKGEIPPMSAHTDRSDAVPQRPARDTDRQREDLQSSAAPSQSPIDVYGNLTPQETHTLARAFIQRMRGINDAEAQKYTLLDPDAVLPSQLHDMHRYLSYNHPQALREIMAEPQVKSILDGYAHVEHRRTTEDVTGQPPQD